MKKLILLRHAKSSWKNSYLNDIDRPLNSRGKRDAPIMAEKFNKRNIVIDLIISSSAKRTLDTARVFSSTLKFGSDIQINNDLYGASATEILNCISHIEDNYNNVLVVCHNQGITNLANYLSDYFIDNIPTAGIAGYSFNKNWKDIKEKNSTFLFFDYPKKDLK